MCHTNGNCSCKPCDVQLIKCRFYTVKVCMFLVIKFKFSKLLGKSPFQSLYVNNMFVKYGTVDALMSVLRYACSYYQMTNNYHHF